MTVVAAEASVKLLDQTIEPREETPPGVKKAPLVTTVLPTIVPNPLSVPEFVTPDDVRNKPPCRSRVLPAVRITKVRLLTAELVQIRSVLPTAVPPPLPTNKRRPPRSHKPPP